MHKPPLRWVIIPMLFLVACESYNREATKPDDVTPLQSTARTRIKTADLNCRVVSVAHTTPELESVTDKLGGVVEESVIKNEVAEQQKIRLSRDSLRIIKRYTPVATMTLRLPVSYVDTMLGIITASANFVEQREVNNKDVSLEVERNEMLNESMNRPTIDRPKKQKNAMASEVKKVTEIDRKLDNLRMLEDAAFSTLTIRLFQPEAVDIQTVINPEGLSRINSITAFNNAFLWGADAIINIFVFLTHLWPLLLLIAIGALIYQKLRKCRLRSN